MLSRKLRVWTATTRGKGMFKGERVKVLEGQELVLVGEGLDKKKKHSLRASAGS